MSFQVDHREYLSPHVSGAVLRDWNEMRAKKFAIVDKSDAEELFTKISDWNIAYLPLEAMLLIVESIKNSCLQNATAVVKGFLFTWKGKVSQKRAAEMIFHDCVDCAISNMERLILGHYPLDNTNAYLLLNAVLDLIFHCKVIDNNRKLIALKGKGVDWKEMLEKVRILPVYLPRCMPKF